MQQPKGYLNFVLHAHLPFIRHPEYETFLEETWLFEAISETYLPLLRMFDRLDADGIPINISISFSPTLVSMLEDPLLQQRYVTYVEKLIRLGESEVVRTKGDPDFAPLAEMYLDFYSRNLEDFTQKFEMHILRGFEFYFKKGSIELLTAPGTYPFLPFYEQYPSNVAAHVEAAIDTHHRAFGKVPKGMWLPECGYYPGLEEILKDYEIEHFYTSAHGLLFSPDIPVSGVYAPVQTPNGLAVFGRDISSANLVWSSEQGYPGDPVYRDFYRDIGHDLDFDYIKPYLHLEKIRVNTGYKYFAVTGNTPQKRIYRPERAQKKVREHAENFIYHHTQHINKVSPLMNSTPVITCPFSAELFGHWWFEGPQWLEKVLRTVHQTHELEFILPTKFLGNQDQELQTVQPIFSSWGNKGYAEVWLEGSNDWIYRHIHTAIERLQEVIERFPDASGLKERALNQAAREIMMAQSLDWPVIMRSGTAERYAVNRVKEHIANFYRIYDALGQGNLGTEWLTRVEKKHNIFPSLDYRVFASRRLKKQRNHGHPYAIR
ncbi:glycoside hydrolase family 57 protein [Spirochaeta lutea]|uniref:Glycoside hydrolase n=1 Tax=Spirochaeta lutea TaxID=1480694 RepID=A0A098R032_9SPIO|nr:1,4-alpha-glucan branching protein domain-containing protein [Spirochaeta lutea]KGE73505.1 glycoside hydrolase [Spirochaeta lutea]